MWSEGQKKEGVVAFVSGRTSSLVGHHLVVMESRPENDRVVKSCNVLKATAVFCVRAIMDGIITVVNCKDPYITILITQSTLQLRPVLNGIRISAIIALFVHLLPYLCQRCPKPAEIEAGLPAVLEPDDCRQRKDCRRIHCLWRNARKMAFRRFRRSQQKNIIDSLQQFK